MSQTNSATSCPRCGRATTGKFCIHCGAPAQGANCHKCQASLTPGVRFCHVCGAPTGLVPTGRGNSRLPWVVAAAATVVAILVFVVKFTAPEPPAQQAAEPVSPASPGAAPDISMMGPREQADRLFDMIMTAAEEGDTARVAFHTTMAVQAYEMLGELDNDARYHLGLIHVVRGEGALATAQVDTIEQAVPRHLLAIMLRHGVASLTGDSAAAMQAYRTFLASFDSEISLARPEYELHRRQIDAFRAEAARSVGG